MNVYVDTSALVKIVVTEQHSQEVRTAMASWTLIGAAWITYAELRSAVAAMNRGGRVSGDEVLDARRRIDEIWEAIIPLDLDRALILKASDLAESHRLRALDAIHLAALQAFDAPGRCVMWSWDAELREAAANLGYEVLPPKLN